MYVQDKTETYNLLIMNPLTEFKWEEGFKETLYMDPVNTVSDNVFDYYIFPDLELIKDYSDRETEIVALSEQFIETVRSKKRISIIGNESAGKTLLLKKLYIELSQNSYCCLYCEADALKQVSLNKALLTVFRKNYIDQNGSYDKFLQIPKEKKILLIDDIHNIDKNQIYTVLKWAEEYFGIIIYIIKELFL